MEVRFIFFEGKSKNKYLNFIKQTCYVINLLKNSDYSIIHCNSCSQLGILRGSIPGKLFRNVKVITHSHGIGDKHGSVVEKLVTNVLKWVISWTSDIGFACSDLAAETKYTKAFINSEKFELINNGVDISKYSYNLIYRQIIRNELCISKDAYVLGCVGRLENEKNQEFLIDVFHEYLKYDKYSILLLVGDGSKKRELMEYAVEKGVKNKVVFAGNRDDANKFYSAFDLFLLPSLYEGFPFVLVEAQLNGLLCVTSNNMSSSVNISGGVTMLPIGTDDKKMWKETIKQEKGLRLSANQIREVERKFDINQITNKIEQLYIKKA